MIDELSRRTAECFYGSYIYEAMNQNRQCMIKISFTFRTFEMQSNWE